MNDIVNEVQKQGLYVVNNQDEDHLEEQYYDLISKVDILCDKVDPVETPYKSKYEGFLFCLVIMNRLSLNA
jgi:hypothetical protein